MKFFRFKKALAVFAASAAVLSSVSASVGAVNDFNFSALAASNLSAETCFEKYKEQFGDNATKTNAFEIVKQYQDKADGLILIFENHERRICNMEKDEYSPKTDLSIFSKGYYDGKTCDSELIIQRCQKHTLYDECFAKFKDDSDVVDVIKTYQEMFDAWIPKLINHEIRIQNVELVESQSISCNNLTSEFLK